MVVKLSSWFSSMYSTSWVALKFKLKYSWVPLAKRDFVIRQAVCENEAVGYLPRHSLYILLLFYRISALTWILAKCVYASLVTLIVVAWRESNETVNWFCIPSRLMDARPFDTRRQYADRREFPVFFWWFISSL